MPYKPYSITRSLLISNKFVFPVRVRVIETQLYILFLTFRMKGARSRQEQLARERIQALKNKRKLSKKEEEAKKEKEQEDKESEALESNDPIQLQVM